MPNDLHAPHQSLADAFEAHDIDADAFHHLEHVEVAFALLKKYDFIDASAIYAKGIRTIAANAGALTKFNLTITYAFMSLIGERIAAMPYLTFEASVAANPDLMTKDILSQWYDPDRMTSDTARSVFLMPMPARP